MNWILIALSSYLIMAIVFLVDKYLLTGPLPSPKVYVFFVGVLGLLFLAFIPFVGFYFPGLFQVFLAFLSGTSFILGLFWFFKTVRLFEISRVVPAMGGALPIFAFLLVYVFSLGREKLSLLEFLAFFLLIIGGVLMTYQKGAKISLKSIQGSVVAAFFLALSFVLAKYVYMEQPFWSGFIWIRIGSGLAVLFFLFFSSELKREIFKIKKSFQKETAGIFLTNQVMGASASILQHWAIALAPLASVPIINALQGVQYIFLLIFTVLLSLKSPQILKEEISKKIILQKIVAILLIGAGLALLVFK